MFSDSKGGKVEYFGFWADAAQDRQYRKEALRLCKVAVDRCVDEDVRVCKDTEAALSYLGGNVARAAVLRFRKALEIHDPYEREHAARQACIAIARAFGGGSSTESS
ncbi:hypothetical protein [Sinorhizobium meliloti]|uniref:hypothetical protein n=1 Tax=Rhizobium meliloti TaxID=382 RepID=UPI0002EBAF92|nr:hypothetical protein [Sinorhizobium meliloti]MDE3767570.1 hypothetical protein [Sinorhizobium meliloti]MDE3779800.1 hypothetical protein [Sinorhizobium meliloti]MDE3807425.1 hypothetical protein [Sinorhizobium meliloti]